MSSTKPLLPCNICQKPSKRRCSGCSCRVYCGFDCQKSDWKLHKKYCKKPLSKQQKLAAVESRCIDFGLNFEELKNAADDPNNGYSVERQVWKKLKFGVTDFPCMPSASWSLSDDAVCEELNQLPMSDEFTGWCVSFMTNGDMDPETGELSYMLNASDTGSGDIRSSGLCKGPPTKRILEELLYVAMVNPVNGRPERPPAVLFAHRWGQEVSQELIRLLNDKIGVLGRYESRTEALMSAANNGTDPDGYNWSE